MLTTIKQLCLVVALPSALCASALAGGNTDAGTYVADLPSASGCGRRMVLELFTDDSYLFVQRYLCRSWSPVQMETGAWNIDGEHLVLSSTATETRFSIDAEGLDYVGTRYGQAGLHLQQLK